MVGISILGSGAYAEVHGRVVQNDPRVELLWSLLARGKSCPLDRQKTASTTRSRKQSICQKVQTGQCDE